MPRTITLAILGPTASGKTAFALKLAQAIQGEIVCLDSTTVYREFDIGSSKPTAEDRQLVPHHLLDILAPEEPFSAGHFVQQADTVINDIHARGKTPILVGGTYFYLRALQNGMYPTPIIRAEVIESIEREFCEDEQPNLVKMHAALAEKDPAAAKQIHPNDRYRLTRALAIIRTTGELPSQLKPEPLSEAQSQRLWMKYAMALPRQVLHERIVKRTEAMLSGGLLEEVQNLNSRYPDARALNSIGYNEVRAFLNRQITQKQLATEIVEKTRQLAKRQMTWLRSDIEVRYIDDRDIERLTKEFENMTVALKGNQS